MIVDAGRLAACADCNCVAMDHAEKHLMLVGSERNLVACLCLLISVDRTVA